MTRFTRVVPFVVLALFVFPHAARSQEKPAAAGQPAAEACEQPCFTPYTQAPTVLNGTEIGERLEREYPAELRTAGVGGTAMVWMFVDDEGAVTRVETARSSGVAELDELALDVARDMRFSPAENRGHAVSVWIQLPIRFEPSAG